MAVGKAAGAAVRGETVIEYRTRLMCEAAIGVFLQHGYDGASMELVAAAAGVTKKTLYNRFRSKDQLFAAVTSRLCDTLLAELHDIGDPMAAPVQTELTRFCTRVVQLVPVSPNVDIFRLAINVAGRFPALGRTLRRTSLLRIDASLKSYLDQQVVAGKLDIPDTAFAARYLVGMVTSLLYHSLLGATVHPRAEQTRRFVRGAVELFCTAYQPADKAGSRRSRGRIIS